MNNTIEIRLPQLDEIVEKLDAILTGLAAHAPAPVELVPDPEAPFEQPQTPVQTVSLGELRQKVVELAAKSTEMKDAVREIVKSYAPQVMLIPEDKLSEVWDKLEALEREGV